MQNKKLAIYRILLTILIILAIIMIVIILKKRHEDFEYEEINQEALTEINEVFENKVEDLNEIKDFYMKGYKVIGKIEIPVIDLEYPILEKTTQETMKMSISRFYGNEVNSYGNLSIAGHNNYSGTMFGKNKNLKNGDKIYLTSLDGIKIEYNIYSIFVTDPNDTSILDTIDKNVREVTLITCKNGRSERLIIKAQENIKEEEK